MRDKKGLSTIVTTLIIILLVIVAIGIVWVVVRNVLIGGVGRIDPATECLKLDMSVTQASCDSTAVCSVTVKRNPGGKAIAGVKAIFSNSSKSGSIIDSAGDITELTSIPITATSTTGGVVNSSSGTNKVEVTPYYKDDTGAEQLCSGTIKYTF